MIKILIADDLELSIYKLSTFLKKVGITPRVARHKDEAISELQKAHTANDKAVMQAYGFSIKDTSESDCVAALMKMYQELTKE